mmetsp:Transcript_19343/g.35765  ORF Transcript_19343/g.35765 Transcript_19343/m.35765 type:complete len:897 (-) Transcript_19343:70-2760(-)|eukprot:CAMPEP_0184509736 /NCGR_PEP_ID=MMETSP0198_2-20121128/1441_1 /TAXON_ID=1112570 /ORGANISM="Thraustochytrium sp., Strain LLF1b" /LENGTH=896 /DNA_ID=CAMNT_0026899583 /DNA_START=366 /DNA_END=3056 /DNA_ORIENTATION=-
MKGLVERRDPAQGKKVALTHLEGASVIGKRNLKTRSFFATLLALIGFGLGALFGYFLAAKSMSQAEITFNGEAELISRGVQLSLQNYMSATSVLKTLFDEKNDVGPETFKAFAANLHEKVQVVAYQYLPRVKREERLSYENETRTYWQGYFNDSSGTYPIMNATSSGKMQVASEEDDYFVIKYLEPIEGNEAAINLNVLSLSAQRRTVLEESLNSGLPVAFGPLSIVQETEPDAYSVVVQYPLDSKEAIVLSVIRVPSMVGRVIRSLSGGIELHIFMNDASVGAFSGNDVRSIPGTCITCRKNERYVTESSFNLLERNWTIQVIGNENYAPLNWTLVLLPAFLIVLFFFALATFYLHSLQQEDKQNQALKEQATEQAKKESAAVAEAERQLNDYLAHEVRNPLSVAISANLFVRSTLEGVTWTDDSMQGAAEQDLHLIDTSLRFIHDLLDNMLDLNKFMQGAGTLEVAPLSLLKDVFVPIKTMLDKHSSNVEVKISIEGDDMYLYGDKLRLKQIFLNLAKNSTKFVERGFICLAGKNRPDGMVELAVEDSGPGVPVSTQSTLFKKYHESLDQLRQGTGVGLCLCKVLVDSMEGDISLDTSYKSPIPGRPGARFRLVLPLKKVEDIAIDVNAVDLGSTFNQNDATSTQFMHNIMVIDDDTVVRNMLRRRFSKLLPECNFVEMSCGEDALELLQGTKVNSFDLIIVDHYMPGPNAPLRGDEVIRSLRSRGCTSVIIGSSGNDVSELHLKSGADAFFRKPLPSNTELLTKLTELWEQPRLGSILIVDDETINRKIMERTLSKLFINCQFEHATNGSEAIEMAEKKSYGVIILDEHMGDISGTVTAKRLRASGCCAMLISVSGGLLQPSDTCFNLVWGKPLPPSQKMKADLLSYFRKKSL